MSRVAVGALSIVGSAGGLCLPSRGSPSRECWDRVDDGSGRGCFLFLLFLLLLPDLPLLPLRLLLLPALLLRWPG